MISIRLDEKKSVHELRQELAERLKKRFPRKKMKNLYEEAVRMTPYLECPKLKKKRRTGPWACMTCPYGHLTECHYPMRCEEARLAGKCGH
ncbi:MAG: hypothetical protein ACTSRB_14715 [Candidatus Helarchaeota archaeon]